MMVDRELELARASDRPASLRTEPAVVVGIITGLGAAVVALLVAFSVPLSGAQQTAILGLLAVVAPLIAALITRRLVWSPTTVNRLYARSARRHGGVDAARGEES